MATARFGAAAGVIGGKLYVAGGDTACPPCIVTNTTEVYDPATNTWTPGAPIPVGRELAMGAVANGRLYVIGGSAGAATLDRVDIYDPGSNSWTTGAPMPIARRASAVGVINGRIYVVGGGAGAVYLTANESYDPTNNTWTEEAPMSVARTYLSGGVANFKLYVIDGFAGAQLNTNEAFDPSLTAQITINPTFPNVNVSGSPNPSIYGQTVIFTATVAPPFGPASTPTGTVTFTIDGTQVSVQTLVNGQATFSTNSLIGTSCPPAPAQCFGHTVTAAYGGDTIYQSASRSTNQFVNRGQPNATLTSTPNPSAFGQTVTFTATLTDPSVVGTPGGIVTFSVDGSQVAAPGLVNGQATFVTSTLTGGSHNVSVNYNGDLNFQSVSRSTNQTVNLPPPSLNVSPTTLAKNSGNNFNFSGTGTPGASVSLFDGSNPGAFACCGSVGPDGAWSMSVFVDGLLVGTHSVTAKQQGNGTTSGASTAVTVHVRPSVPGISSPSSVSSSVTPASVSLSGFGFYGNGQNPPAGAAVTIFENQIQIGTAVVQPGGQWSTTVLLAWGSHTLKASQTLAGETSDLSNAFTVTVTQPLTLLSISVTPTGTSVGVGETQQFQASGFFSDGLTRQLSTGSSGGNGGTSTPTWNVHFTQSLNVGACASGTTFSSQAVTPNSSGVVSGSWGTPQTVQVNGTVASPTAPAPQVNLTLTCIPANGATGSVTATWTGTRYEGTATLSGVTVPVVFTGWSTKTSLSTARSGIGAATVNGIVYALGGGSPNQVQPVDAYDPVANTWSTVAQMQTSREGAGVAALNNKIYVAGGHIAGGAASGLLEAFDPATNLWNAVPLPSMPTPRAHLVLVAAGGKLYAIGGDTGSNNSGVTAVVEIYDPAQNQWFARMPMSTPRNFFVGGALNNGATIVVSGGAVPPTELYDVASDSWTVGAAMSGTGGLGSATVANNALWVFGANGSTQMFRLAIGQLPSGWSTLGGGLTGRGQAGAATVGDVAYVIGGQVNGAAVATVEAFSAPPPSDLAVNTGGGGGGGGSSSLPAVQWQSQNTGVATINSSGFATGTGPGQTNIVASACPTTSTCDPAARISGSATLTVIPPTFVTFTLAPGSLTPPGNQVSITLSQPPSPDSHTEVVTLGQAESVDKPGTVHVVFNPPTGYTVSPAERDVTINAGDNLSVPLFFALIDTIPPVLTVSNNVTAEATSAAGAAVTFATATATDAGSGVQSVSCDRAPGDAFPIGTTTVSCSATDNNGNTANASFTVSVVDTTPPVLTLLGANPMTVEGGATFTDPGATATDVVAGTLTAQIHVTGSVNTAVVGTYSLTYAVSDGHGNTTTATRTVNVVDTTKPTLNLPANITVDATSPAGAVVVYSVSATDIVSGAVSVNCSKLSGSTFPIGTTAVTCSATDAANNTVNGTFTVLVQAAAAQVSNLTVTVESFNLVQGIQNSLDTKLQNVLSALSAAVGGNVTNVCNQMSAFINETTAQSGKKLTVAQANQLLVSAQQIRAVIGCQ